MPANVGRELIVTQGGDVIMGVRTASISYGNDSIDITTGEDDGFRTLLSAPAQKQLDIAIEGIMKDNIFLNLTLSDGDPMLSDVVITWPIFDETNAAPATLTGTFRLTGLETGAAYNDAITFSTTLESSGPWVFTPEALA